MDDSNQPPKAQLVPSRFSEIVHIARDQASLRPSIGDLLNLLGPKGHYLFILILVLPFLQPIPIPGFSTAIGLVMTWVSLFIFLDLPPHLPKKLAGVKFQPQSLEKIAQICERFSLLIEKIVRPRGKRVMTKKWFKRLNGLVLAFHAVLLSLPLPIPLSNFLPAIVIFLTALASLEEDIYLIAVAYVGVVVNMVYFLGLVALPFFSFHSFKDLIF